MFGATAQAQGWGAGTPVGDDPTLSAAPDGLSARRVERWLNFPAGAWHKRRLYALRLRGQAFAGFGLQAGDLVVVEPGAKEQPGGLVVTRAPGGLSLRRLPRAVESRSLPTVLELPLRERGIEDRGHVVGAVLGVLRATGTGALRPVYPSTRHSPKARSPARPTAIRSRSAMEPEPGVLDQLLQTRDRWRLWLARANGFDGPEVTSRESERRERLDGSLTTLCDCLARTHSTRLRSALAAEAYAVIAAMRNEMDG